MFLTDGTRISFTTKISSKRYGNVLYIVRMIVVNHWKSLRVHGLLILTLSWWQEWHCDALVTDIFAETLFVSTDHSAMLLNLGYSSQKLWQGLWFAGSWRKRFFPFQSFPNWLWHLEILLPQSHATFEWRSAWMPWRWRQVRRIGCRRSSLLMLSAAVFRRPVLVLSTRPGTKNIT